MDEVKELSFDGKQYRVYQRHGNAVRLEIFDQQWRGMTVEEIQAYCAAVMREQLAEEVLGVNVEESFTPIAKLLLKFVDFYEKDFDLTTADEKPVGSYSVRTIVNLLHRIKNLRSALEKIRDPSKRDHKEPDAYTALGCVMNIADEALTRDDSAMKAIINETNR